MALTVKTTYVGAAADIARTQKGVTDRDFIQSQNRTSIQRIGWLVNSVGVAHLCYYDPVADAITYEDGVFVAIGP